MSLRHKQAIKPSAIHFQSWGKWLVSGIFLVTFISSGAWVVFKLNDPATLPISKVQVSGDFVQLQESMLKKAFGGQMNEGYFTVDVKSLKARVEKLAWVDTAAVRRKWPDTLVIHITEQKSLALWADGGVVNQRGELFYPDPNTHPGGLPVFKGKGARSQELTTIYRGISVVLSPIKKSISQLELDERGAIQVKLEAGMQILLGREGTTERLVRFVELYDKMFAEMTGSAMRVDLRYANGIAVRWNKDVSKERG